MYTRLRYSYSFQIVVRPCLLLGGSFYTLLSPAYLSGPSQTQKNQGDGDLQTKVAGSANLATEGNSKRSHWCSRLDCLPSAKDATNNISNFIVLQFVWN